MALIDLISSDRPNATARGYLISGALWGVAGATVGVVAAATLVAPDAFTAPWLSFGRLRPLHVNLVAFGFVYSLLVAGAAHIVPRLCRLEALWSERLGTLSLWLWNAVFVAAFLTLPFGMTQGREYAELVWGIDVLVALSVASFTLNIIMTVLTRREPILYVSLWYICGGLVWASRRRCGGSSTRSGCGSMATTSSA